MEDHEIAVKFNAKASAMCPWREAGKEVQKRAAVQCKDGEGCHLSRSHCGMSQNLLIEAWAVCTIGVYTRLLNSHRQHRIAQLLRESNLCQQE